MTTRPCFVSNQIVSSRLPPWASASSLMIVPVVRVAIAPADAIKVRRRMVNSQSGSVLANTLHHAIQSERRYERRDVAAQHRYLLDEARGDELMPFARHQVDRLDVRRHAVVHAEHLKLE